MAIEMSTPTKNVAAAEIMTFEDPASPSTPFAFILNDKALKAAYKKCKSQSIKCKSSSAPVYQLLYLRASSQPLICSITA